MNELKMRYTLEYNGTSTLIRATTKRYTLLFVVPGGTDSNEVKAITKRIDQREGSRKRRVRDPGEWGNIQRLHYRGQKLIQSDQHIKHEFDRLPKNLYFYTRDVYERVLKEFLVSFDIENMDGDPYDSRGTDAYWTCYDWRTTKYTIKQNWGSVNFGCGTLTNYDAFHIGYLDMSGVCFVCARPENFLWNLDEDRRIEELE